MAEPVLELETELKRPEIIINKTLYEIATPEELSVVEMQQFRARGRRMDVLMGKNSLTKSQQLQLTKLLHDTANRILIDVPKEVREKLSDAQLIQVAEVFSALPLLDGIAKMKEAGAKPKAKTTRKRTGAKRPRASKGSTAATPEHGSTTSPSTLSEPT